ASRDMHLGFAGSEQAAFGVVANDVRDGPADADQPVRVVEQLQIAVVPGHQLKRLVHHADALRDVLDGALQQGPVELQDLGGFAKRMKLCWARSSPTKRAESSSKSSICTASSERLLGRASNS
nr:hypothetical protein [Tanacetum cinerariifolium]